MESEEQPSGPEKATLSVPADADTVVVVVASTENAEVAAESVAPDTDAPTVSAQDSTQPSSEEQSTDTEVVSIVPQDRRKQKKRNNPKTASQPQPSRKLRPRNQAGKIAKET